MEEDIIYKYWGKSQIDENDELKYHLLVYHSLDVAAVGEVWLRRSPVLEVSITGCDVSRRQWLLFFLALHDFGKWDLRFQSKVKKLRNNFYGEYASYGVSDHNSKTYYHGEKGLAFLRDCYSKLMGNHTEDADDFDIWGDDEDEWDSWAAWAEAVTAHHGLLIKTHHANSEEIPIEVPSEIKVRDVSARAEWIRTLEELCLKPFGLSIEVLPPELNLGQRTFVAGFCSICDWLGSSIDISDYQDREIDLRKYYANFKRKIAPFLLERSGLIGVSKKYEGLEALLKIGYTPRQIQTVVNDIKPEASLIIIEAPTGSGKTETAVALAWRLLSEDKAEGIVFALPTQATANAMFERLESLAPMVFEKGPNLILAHGNASFNEQFNNLKIAPLNKDDGWVQCTNWLGQSRKRAFLGQVGISTIDQVLTSVLPVKHRFIRSFGLNRSVLIVDEVHAYDCYMYGLLTEVIKRQRESGGTVILLSATLPKLQRVELLSSWGRIFTRQETETPSPSPYPLVSQIIDNTVEEFTVLDEDLPPLREIKFDVKTSEFIGITDEIIEEVIKAAVAGANVALVCNIVAEAQRVYKKLKKLSNVPVLLFHSRYALKHRQAIEQMLLDGWGAECGERKGGIVVATQVVEQSLDVDFDWMITQLCPCDLLFQRIGRLHRHGFKDRYRPIGFKEPLCTVVIPNNLLDKEDYGGTGFIYNNFRVLYRTAVLLLELSEPLRFPDAYRSWIETVYCDEAWAAEDENVTKQYKDYLCNVVTNLKCQASEMLKYTDRMVAYGDDDAKVQALTRSGDMGITTLPYLETHIGMALLDGSILNLDKPDSREHVAMSKVGVPQSWIKDLEPYLSDKAGLEGMFLIPMVKEGDCWKIALFSSDLEYSIELGMEKKNESITK